MGKMGQDSDSKSHLVSQICAIQGLSNACVHTRQRLGTAKLSSFVDWYRVLGVEEEAGIDVIRKQYHKLALQLHPDKNKHPKAEIAFKLVSEAHICLSDIAKRRAFDLQRWKNLCFQCKVAPANLGAPTQKAWSAPSRLKSSRFLRSLRDIRDRFREETKVIEKCLRANAVNAATTKNETASFGEPDSLLKSASLRVHRKESPVFNPSDYSFDGYPHLRNRVQRKPGNFRCLQAEISLSSHRRIGKCDSPVFEIRSDRGILRSNSAIVHS